MTTCLFSAVKDEGPDLLEWVCYHRVIGFERIVLWSNDCTDGSDLLLDALAGLGWITHHRHSPPEGVSVQDNVARLALEAPELAAADWAMWLDADEFLCIHAGDGRLPALLAAIGPADALALCWRIFGTAGQLHSTGAPVLSDFTRAGPLGLRMSRTIKTLFRNDARIAAHFIHRPIWAEGAEIAILGADGRPIEGFAHKTKGNGRPEELVPRGRRSWQLAQVNHYAVKALDRVAAKRMRGDGLGLDAARFGLSYLNRYDRNDEEDRAILRHQPAVLAAMAEALDAPPVLAAMEACARRFGAMLEALAPQVASLAAARQAMLAAAPLVPGAGPVPSSAEAQPEGEAQ